MSQKKVLFITVGTSALTARYLGAGLNADAKDCLLKARERYLEAPSQVEERESGLIEQALAAHRHHWVHLHPDGEAEQTSAEMTSTSLLLQDYDERLPGVFTPGRDRIVLLASDTEEGGFCARVNARLMCEFLLGCRCEGECRSISIEVVSGLEAKDKPFVAITENLRQIVDKCERDYGSDLFFNITGGYKMAVPSIAYLSWRRERNIPLFYLHVTNRDAVRIDFLPRVQDPHPGAQQTTPAIEETYIAVRIESPRRM